MYLQWAMKQLSQADAHTLWIARALNLEYLLRCVSGTLHIRNH